MVIILIMQMKKYLIKYLIDILFNIFCIIIKLTT